MARNEFNDEFLINRERYLSLMKSRKWGEGNKIYWEKLAPKVEKRFLNQIREKKKSGEIPKYDLLILPMGLTNKYHVLLIKALKPKKVFFLGVSSDEKNILTDTIKRTNLTPDKYEKVIVENLSDLTLIRTYEEIKKVIERNRGKKIAIDLSRGKRTVTAGSALAGEFFECDITHISKESIEDIRIPGTEKLVILNKFLYAFGDLENKYARELFNWCDYSSATSIFQEILTKTRDPRKFEIKLLISKAYMFWDGFHYKAAFLKLSEAIQKITQYGFDWPFLEQLKGNLKALEILEKMQSKDTTFDTLKNSQIISYVAVDLYCNAGRRKYQNKFEDAISRLYRAAELVSQNRLALRGIDTSKPNLEKLAPYQERFRELTKKIYGKEKLFPNKISLMNGHILLFAMGDELWANKSWKNLKQLYEVALLRDLSLIAHGLQSVDQKRYQKFKKILKKILLDFFYLQKEKYEYLIKLHTHTKFE